MLKWIVWSRTVWLNWIAWNRNVFDNWTVLTFKLCAYTKLNCLKFNLVLNDPKKGWYSLKQNNQPTNNQVCWLKTIIFIFCLPEHKKSLQNISNAMKRSIMEFFDWDFFLQRVWKQFYSRLVHKVGMYLVLLNILQISCMNLRTNQYRPYCAFMNRNSSLRLLSWQWDGIEVICTLCNLCIYNDWASSFSFHSGFVLLVFFGGGVIKHYLTQLC